jgi:hypothetical protein
MMMMIGPDGVGKTTLLATMYHQFDKQSDFELAASKDTDADLREAYLKLSNIITQPTFTPTGPLLRGTAGIVERKFEMLFKGKKELDLVFYDIAGGLIHADSDHPDFEDFQNKLEESLVIMIVIDGSVLVEGDEFLLAQRNDPLQIYKLLMPTLINAKRDHLLLFVITKCEAWLKNESRRTQLETAFEKCYEIVLNMISEQNNVAGVLIPVKTLGCVEFTHIDYHDRNQELIFVRKPNLEFRPQNTDQALRYALAFALLQHDQHRNQWNRLMRWLRDENVVFQQALSDFAEARNRSFKIYGNASLIEVSKE